MKISQKGIDFIKAREDEKFKAYQDSAGIWTIGVGHIKGVKKGMVITPEQSTQFLLEDLADAEAGVNKLVKVPITQNQYDALVSFTFNLGKGALQGSTLLRLLNAGKKEQAADAFLAWNKARVKGKLVAVKGLTIRRQLEKELFLS